MPPIRSAAPTPSPQEILVSFLKEAPMSSWTLDPASVRRSPQESTESAHRQGLGTNLSDDVAQARSQRLLSDAKAALRFALALRDSRVLQHNALHRSHFNPNQPRVPIGHPDGGQWTSMGARNDPRVISDANPDDGLETGCTICAGDSPLGGATKNTGTAAFQSGRASARDTGGRELAARTRRSDYRGSILA